MPIWVLSSSFPVRAPVRHMTSVGLERLKDKGAKEAGSENTPQGLGQKLSLAIGLLCWKAHAGESCGWICGVLGTWEEKEEADAQANTNRILWGS